jgi:hypothetical protein
MVTRLYTFCPSFAYRVFENSWGNYEESPENATHLALRRTETHIMGTMKLVLAMTSLE